MLGNNEQIQGVDLKAVFTKMLVEVPWENLKTYILANAQLTKLCTIGGFRLEPKQRQRAENFIMRDVEKNKFSEILCNGVFASWYPVHKDLHQKLEDYFHSDEYKQYREAKSLAEDEYVLSDEKFGEFYNVSDFEAWRILLCFSPLKFSASQASAILEDKKGDADLMGRLTKAESERDDLAKKVAQLSSDVEKLRQKQQADQSEIQDLRKQTRQCKADAELFQKRLDSAVSEMKRATQQASQADAAIEQREASVREEMGRLTQRQQGEIERLSKELTAWQSRHEEQCGVNRGLVERAEAADKRANEALAEKNIFEKKVTDCYKLVDALLSRIDWPHVGSAMKLSPTVKRNFNSLVKRLDYDENRNLTIEGTLTSFWERLSKKERDLVDAIAKSTEKELLNGSINEYWQGLAEQFGEVLTNLEARMAMLSILQDIFFQTYTDEDLHSSSIVPKAAKAKKKRVMAISFCE